MDKTDRYISVKDIGRVCHLHEEGDIEIFEVVRCRDCKYYIADGCDECVLMSAKSIIASINSKRWYSDFYCAWGETKDEQPI